MNHLFVCAAAGMGGLGFVFGVGLAVAAKKLAVPVDPKVEAILAALPGANCGACGLPGCQGAAEAIAAGELPVDACSAGGAEISACIAEIIGVEVKEDVPQVAFVKCQGGKKEAKGRFLYQGIEDCPAAQSLQGGAKACSYGCLGLGSCVRACPFDALHMNENGLPQVDEFKCTACGICVVTCPRDIITLIPRSRRVSLGCCSHDSGKIVKGICNVGCFACRICASPKVTPSGAITMEDNLPVIDFDKGGDLNNAVAKCPAHCYVVRDIGSGVS